MAGLISQALPIREDGDPAVAIRLRTAEFLDGMRIGGGDILVGVYEPGEQAKTASGLILPAQTRDEYRWQGITGLVLKLGPLAYQTEKTCNWFAEGEFPKVGDWVMFDVKNSHSFLMGKQPCRFVGCQYVLAIVDRPDMVA